MTIWANTIVNNEENFIWFAIMSVVDYVDEVLVWDTGSTDRTIKVIEEIRKIKGKKIEFKKVGRVDKWEFTKMRQRMLEQSRADWILILDGDEIWWNDSIQKLVREIHKNGNVIDGVVVPMVVPVGDIFHLQEEAAGGYKLLGKRGHLSLKAFSKNIPGLHVEKPYGKEGFFDGGNQLIQKREKMIFLDAPFLHVTHLKRSSQTRKYEKFKYELGDKVKKGFKFPEVLYTKTPKIVASPWSKITGTKFIWASVLTPLRKLKRRIQ